MYPTEAAPTRSPDVLETTDSSDSTTTTGTLSAYADQNAFTDASLEESATALVTEEEIEEYEERQEEKEEAASTTTTTSDIDTSLQAPSGVSLDPSASASSSSLLDPSSTMLAPVDGTTGVAALPTDSTSTSTVALPPQV